MKQQYTALPGVSLPSISLGSGVPILGVTVDNATGGWLYLVEPQAFVPPYTQNWSRDLDYAGQSISVVYGQSPDAMQVSTLQGLNYTVTLNSDHVGFSQGDVSFIPTTQSSVTTFGVTLQGGSFGNTVIPAIAGKVIRLEFITAGYSGYPSDIPFYVTLVGTGQFNFLNISGILVPQTTLIFPDKGLFLPISKPLTCNVQIAGLWQNFYHAIPVLGPPGVYLNGQYAYV